jgi:hypothetical protein
VNFDPKYLIRWGIPGWILLMTLIPYFVVIYYDSLPTIISEKNVLALGAAITLIGIPLGYFLNQMHHLLGWVANGKWDNYFSEEIIVDDFLCDKDNEGYKERYRYLLAKKHEVGSVYASFILSALVILITNIYESSKECFDWLYFFVTVLLIVAWYFLRSYSSRNIDKYFEHLKRKATS